MEKCVIIDRITFTGAISLNNSRDDLLSVSMTWRPGWQTYRENHYSRMKDRWHLPRQTWQLSSTVTTCWLVCVSLLIILHQSICF